MVEGTRCFYEPLHEELATLSRDDIARLRPDNWASRHPAMVRPYYDEYADLLNADGIGPLPCAVSLDNAYAYSGLSA